MSALFVNVANALDALSPKEPLRVKGPPINPVGAASAPVSAKAEVDAASEEEEDFEESAESDEAEHDDLEASDSEASDDEESDDSDEADEEEDSESAVEASDDDDDEAEDVDEPEDSDDDEEDFDVTEDLNEALATSGDGGGEDDDAEALRLLQTARDSTEGDALAAWRAVIGTGKYLLEAWGSVLQLLHTDRQWEELLTETERALENRDHGAAGYALLKRSIALQNLGRLDEALRAVDESIALQESTAHWQRACVLTLLNRKEEAVAAIRAELTENPGCRRDMLADSDFRPLHDVPAFQALRRG